jgi:hypothetical protein
MSASPAAGLAGHAGERSRFCVCGQDFPAAAGRRRSGYRAAAHERFAGRRKEIREGRLCRACGSGARLQVHKPRVHERELRIRVCAGCLARVHRLAALRAWIPERLVGLWIEPRPRAPFQLPFPAGAA